MEATGNLPSRSCVCPGRDRTIMAIQNPCKTKPAMLFTSYHPQIATGTATDFIAKDQMKSMESTHYQTVGPEKNLLR